MEGREFGGELALSHEHDGLSSLRGVCRAPVVDLVEQVPGVRLDVAPRPQLAPLQAAAEILDPGGELVSGQHAPGYSRRRAGVSSGWRGVQKMHPRSGDSGPKSERGVK
jgi:hypothetical protein